MCVLCISLFSCINNELIGLKISMNIVHYRYCDTKYKIQKFNKLTKIWALHMYTLHMYIDCEELYRCLSVYHWVLVDAGIEFEPAINPYPPSVDSMKMRTKKRKKNTYENFATIRFAERLQTVCKIWSIYRKYVWCSVHVIEYAHHWECLWCACHISHLSLLNEKLSENGSTSDQTEWDN